MCALSKLLAVARYFVVVVSVVSSFAAGAIFAETHINQQANALTFYLASVPCPQS